MKRTLATLCAVLLAGSAFAVAPMTDCYFPAFGHALGAADAKTGVRPHWTGDVWIFNPSTTTVANVTIFLLLRNQANPNPDSRAITVNPGETRYLYDIILTTFGQDNLFAGLRITSDIPVVCTGRSYDANVNVVQKGVGTAGQFFAGLSPAIAVANGQTADVIGLDQDQAGTSGQWRSNLAVVEVTGNSANLQLQRVDSNGTVLGTKDYGTILGRDVTQINYVVTDIVSTPGTDQRVRVLVTGGTGKVIAVASRIDNTTGDPSTVDMTTSAALIPSTGRFEGIVFDFTGARIDGGMQIQVGSGVLTGYSGVAGIPCPDDSNSFTVDFSPVSIPTSIPVNTDGTFSTSVSIPYSDGATTLFTTNWTLAGARQTDGTWIGTLKSDTTGGTGNIWGPCNAMGVTRNWRVGWTGN